MKQVRRRLGCLATAASMVHLVLLVKVVAGRGSKKDVAVLADFPAVVSTNRCSDLDLTGFAKAMNCGPPLSAPCFDFSRCRDRPTVYVYDSQVSLRQPPNACFLSFASVICTNNWPYSRNMCSKREDFQAIYAVFVHRCHERTCPRGGERGCTSQGVTAGGRHVAMVGRREERR